ncbi:sensor histidine kinase [Archangium primigenium]|uniref:sensor histidine kinase n=1 Tax=[Archangium] primigenium TaxID=2792470 RepID=UPI00195C90DB|nr:HAMP domain-containing sensor histidine kinase [Archangium primigenium]MBM7114508.1 HAMP domain-containing histidine kinase [Archangium primigenium]
MSWLFRWGAPLSAALVSVLGSLVLMGWSFGLTPLTRVHPSLPSMVPLSAVSLVVLAGGLAGLWSGGRWMWAARLAAGSVSGWSLLLLALYAWIAWGSPLRVPAACSMSTPTTVSFVLLAGAMGSASGRGHRLGRPAPWLTLAAMLPPLVALAGYVFQDHRLYAPGPHGGMAVHTATGLLLLSAGTLALDATWGFMGALTTRAAGGVLARRMLPAALLPLLLGGLLTRASRAGLLDPILAQALFGVLMMLAFAVLTWLNALRLNRGHAEQVKAEQRALSEAERQRVLAADNARLLASAEKAARDREQVLAVVSHDLKNPLSVIRLSTTLLATRLAGTPVEAGLGRQVAAIDRAAAHMLTLIHQLLDAARLDAGQALAVEPRSQPLAPVVEEALALVEPQASQKALALERRLEPGLEAAFDRDRILQVLANLLGNAVKFTPLGGRITVEAWREGDDVRVRVHDTGPGIPELLRDRLFERHWQARETASQGSGLGLYIARGIIDAHGGRIWVEEGRPLGAAFVFCLPPRAREA